jgi:hypothetical protein
MAVGLVFAQDETPTVEVPGIVTPVPDVAVEQPPTTQVNTVLDWLQFVIDNNLHWYLFAFITVIFVGNLVPQSEMDQRREYARQTPTPIDDAFWTLLDIVQSLKGGLQVMPNPNPGVPIPTIPKRPTLPAETDDNIVVGFMDIFGVMGLKQTWKQSGHPDAVIEIPAGYNHTPVYLDGGGTPYPAKAIETNDKYGTRLNIAHIGSIHRFTRQSRPVAAKGKNIITLEYEAEVNDATGRDPHYNWLWLNCYVNGKEVVSAQREGDTTHHIATQNGLQQASWYYDSDKAEPVEVAFEVVIHWALAGNMSHIDLKRASLKKA